MRGKEELVSSHRDEGLDYYSLSVSWEVHSMEGGKKEKGGVSPSFQKEKKARHALIFLADAGRARRCLIVEK